LRWKGYRLYFFSREETRRHIHVFCADGEAKFWLEPEIDLASNHRLTEQQLGEIRQVIEERKDEIVAAWHRHFPG